MKKASKSNPNNQKQNKKKPVLLIVIGVIVLFVVILMLLPSDDSGESAADDAEGSGQTEDLASSDGESSGYGNLADSSQYPIGTCAELDGTTLVISIFADDNSTSWNQEDEQDLEMMRRMYGYLSKGFDWISEQGKNYGKNITFVSDFTANEDLAYTRVLDADFADGYAHRDVQKEALLEDGWDTKGPELMAKYGADNIMFVYYFNEPMDTNMVSGAAPYFENEQYSDLPFDTMVLSPYVYGQEQGPATYAHETLHLFGAPDFYAVDVDGSNFGMTEEFVNYCQENHANEIMTNNYDIVNMRVDLEKVTNELTDLTAYYIGWIDSNSECEEWGVATSEHNR